MSNQELFSTAVVVGGSIAGSSVAAALAPHFEQIVVVDRDELPSEPLKRKGAPHGQQFHALTVGGRLALEELFPGLTADLRSAGVPWTDPACDTWYCSKYGFFARQPSQMRMLQPTRRYLEWYLRQRTRALDNVTFLSSTRVIGLRVGGGAVTGVDAVDEKTGESKEFAADLVVDASGRVSQAPAWLEAAGYPPPVETTVNARWGYATTYVSVPEDWHPGYRSLYVGPTITGQGHSATRGAAMWQQENNTVVVTAQGCAGDWPPGDLDGLKEYLASVDSSEFLDLINEYGTSGPIEVWRNTTSRLRDFAKLDERPEGFVVVGDATAALNPVHGQGMALAAMAACTLGASIEDQRKRGDLAGFAAGFQTQLSELLTAAWTFSTSSDLTVPGVEVNGEPREPKPTHESEFASRILALATEDATVAIKFRETANFLRDARWMAEEDLRERVLADWDRLGALTR